MVFRSLSALVLATAMGIAPAVASADIEGAPAAAVTGASVRGATSIASPEQSNDESGHVSVLVGALAGDDAGSLTARPLLRAEVAFNIAGPIAAGGFVQVAFLELPMQSPAFGGGALITVRPDVPLLGFVPHIELTASRLQLPSTVQSVIDAWSIGIGGGIGARLTREIALEARVHHGWYFGLPAFATISDHAWTAGVALNVDLP